MSQQLSKAEIRRILEEEDDVVFEESGDKFDHVSVRHDSEEDVEELVAQRQNCASTDEKMNQPIANFATTSIYKGKSNTIWYRNPSSACIRTRCENIVSSRPVTKKPCADVKRRCYMYPVKKFRKSKYICIICSSHICMGHANFLCENCRLSEQ